MKFPLRAHLIAVAALLPGIPHAAADDWPQWLGPQRDGVWRETGILTAVPADGVKIRWRAKINQGYSGPAVADGKVFVTDRRLNPDREGLICLNEADGELLWQHDYPCEYADMEYGNGPRATPTIHAEKVYTLGTRGHLFCYDAKTGSVLWQKDLVGEYKAREPRYGISAAPIIVDDLLIVIVGGENDAAVVAFDRLTGAERWRALGDPAAYSAPVVIEHGGVRQLIVWLSGKVASLDPANGTVYWESPFKVGFDDAQIIASPVLRGDQLLCMGGFYRGSLMLDLDPQKPVAVEKWRTRKQPTTTFATPWFPDVKHFYVALGSGGFGCLLAETGDEVWSTMDYTGERVGTAHLTPIGDGDGNGGGGRALLFNQKGQLILVNLSPQGHEELGRCLLVEATAGYRPQGPIAWSHPAYANRSVYARNDRELVCASLAADDNPIDPNAAPLSTSSSRTFDGLEGRKSARGIAISPDGKLTAAGTWIGVLKLIRHADGSELPVPKKHRYSVHSVDFSPDGRSVVSAGGNEFQKDAEIVLWQPATGKELARINGHDDKIYSVAFSPDGKTIATGSADHAVKLWDAATLKEQAVLNGHADAVLSLAYAPDGKALVSVDWSGMVRIWNTADETETASFRGHDEEILSVAISPDGKTIATGSTDWTVRLWDFAARRQTAELSGHRGAVYCLAFSPDGKQLASGSGDQTIKLWDVDGATESTTLRGHDSGITDLAYSPDGNQLTSAGRDDAVRAWSVAP